MEEHKSTYGLIGYPVNHSLSPLMHNAAFRELNVDAVYKLFSLKEEEIDGFFTGLRSEDSPIFGLNVTVPYKEKAIKYMDSVSPYAEKVQAINTVVISKDRKLTGHNTDGPGFLTHLTKVGFESEGKRIAILGAGGAARAIISVFSLMPDRPEVIRIFDVDKQRADNLLLDFSQRFDVSRLKTVASIDDLNIELSDLLINATPIGMHAGDDCLVDESLLHPNMLVYDLIYNPKETKLLKLAAQKGAETSNGLGMLFYQGVLAFQHWAEIQLTQEIKDKMWENLNAGLKND